MRILILSFYYPPDLCAGSFRAKALVEGLRAEGSLDLSIEVLTTRPNRYQSHQAEAPDLEESPGLRIRRFHLPSHKSGMADQAKAFIAFARQAWTETRGGKWDLVLATSSRLMTAALGAQIARRSRTPLYLDIRDLFTDTMNDLLGASPLRHLLPLFRALEKRTLSGADRVNVVSAGFLPHLRALAPTQHYATFTNGIDDEFLSLDFTKPEDAQGLPLVVYAGNMGEGQGLHRIVPQAARLMAGKARFRLIGDGGRRAQLEKALADEGVDNVELFSAMPRSELYDHYRAADVLFLHLNDHPAFRKVLPSKLFEYGAMGKPVLAGVAGYPAEFLRAELPGCEVFAPCDAEGMAAALHRIFAAPAMGQGEAFCSKFARRSIMRDMARDVLALAAADGRG